MDEFQNDNNNNNEINTITLDTTEDDESCGLKLTHVTVAGLLSYNSKVEFEFRNGVLLLVGPTGAGKSNVISLVEMGLNLSLAMKKHGHQPKGDNPLLVLKFQVPPQGKHLVHRWKNFIHRCKEPEEVEEILKKPSEAIPVLESITELVISHQHERDPEVWAVSSTSAFLLVAGTESKKRSAELDSILHGEDLAIWKIEVQKLLKASTKIVRQDKYLSFQEPSSTLVSLKTLFKIIHRKDNSTIQTINQLLEKFFGFGIEVTTSLAWLLTQTFGDRTIYIRQKKKRLRHEDMCNRLEKLLCAKPWEVSTHLLHLYYHFKSKHTEEILVLASKCEAVLELLKKLYDCSLDVTGTGILVHRVTNKNVQFPLTTAPGGVQQMLLVLTALLDSACGTVLLDEPTAALHPSKIKELRQFLYTNRSSNVLIVTHAPQLLSEEVIESCVHCRFDPKTEATIVNKLSGLAGQGIKVGKSLQPAVCDMFFAEKALFVEGYADEKLLRSLFMVLADDPDVLTQWNLSAEQISSWSLHRLESCSNIHPVVVAYQLQIPFMMVLDGDVAKFDPVTVSENDLRSTKVYKHTDRLYKQCGTNILLELVHKRAPLKREMEEAKYNHRKDANSTSEQNLEDVKEKSRTVMQRFKEEAFSQLGFIIWAGEMEAMIAETPESVHVLHEAFKSRIEFPYKDEIEWATTKKHPETKELAKDSLHGAWTYLDTKIIQEAVRLLIQQENTQFKKLCQKLDSEPIPIEIPVETTYKYVPNEYVEPDFPGNYD